MTPRWEGTFRLGDMLVVLALIASAVAAWMANRERSLTNAAAIAEIAADIDGLEVRVRALEITTGQLAGIAGDLAELRSDVKALIQQHAAIERQ